MNTILFIIRKEFLQIRRNKKMLPIIFLVPLVQLLVLVNASTFEVKSVNVHLIDNDKTSFSRKLVDKFSSSGRFIIVNSSNSEKSGLDDIEVLKAKMILNIPQNFEKDIINGKNPKIQVVINALDGMAAGVISSYCTAILFDFNLESAVDFHFPKINSQMSSIEIHDRFLYNPELNYKFYMVPGVLVILVTIIGLFLSGMNIVREKELGTIEQLNVTPIKKYQFIFGKLFPFWVIANFDLALGLSIGKLVYNIPIEGNLALVFAMASVYLVVILALGLLISTMTQTQQQSMYISFFFVMIFILMSGLFTPISSMPEWAQIVAFFNPVSHFIEFMRRILLKGAGFGEVKFQFAVLSVYGIIMVLLSTWRYKKTSG